MILRQLGLATEKQVFPACLLVAFITGAQGSARYDRISITDV